MSQLLLFRLLTLSMLLAFVSTFYVVTRQSDVIEQQRQTIRGMASNPACLAAPALRTFDGEPYQNPAPVVREN